MEGITPNKLQKLMRLAEDASYNGPRLNLNEDFVNRSIATNHSPYGESSSGILDLERLHGFGDSSILSTPFNPGEMTGRSTEADSNQARLGIPGYESYGRHSVASESLTSHMEKQTQEVSEVIRHSIAYSFSSKYNVDLTAEEDNFIKEKFNAPIDDTLASEMMKDSPQNIVSLQESNASVLNMSEREVYFKQKCPNVSTILGNADSPDRYMYPSITEVSSHNVFDITPKKENNTYTVDQNLDSIPVRQPKRLNTAKTKPSEVSRYQAEVSGMSEMGCYFKNGPDPNYQINPIKPLSTQKKPTKPADLLLRNLQTSYRYIPEETETSLENSLSISKIADLLNRQSLVSVSDMLLLNNQVKSNNKKQPLTERQLNTLDNKHNEEEVYVTKLKDARKINTASSTATLSTVVSVDALKMNEQNIPEVIVTKDSFNTNLDQDLLKTPSIVRSKSPSSKSQSTPTTVQENKSFKSSTSPMHMSKGSEANASNIPSPNVVYKELDKSVDWREVLEQKRYNEERLAKAQWVDVIAAPAKGFVGVSTPITINITSRLNSWLTAKIDFDTSSDLNIESPRQPFLVSPGKEEKFIFNVTSNTEIKEELLFSISLKDASIDDTQTQKHSVLLEILMPSIQAVSTEGVNIVSFPTILEKSFITKYFILVSDCPVDLQLELCIVTGDSFFIIRNVQEIKKSDISKALMEPPTEHGKVMGSRQMCRLSQGMAIKVIVMFKAPQLSDSDRKNKKSTVNGVLNVNLMGVNTVLKKVDLIGNIGFAQLEWQSSEKVFISSDPTPITIHNTGNSSGTWIVKFKSASGDPTVIPYKVSPGRLEVRPGETRQIHVVYTGSPDVASDGYLLLEDVITSAITSIAITAGTEKQKSFPIKTNLNNISWIKAGKKELSLKNSTNSKVQIRCQIVGEGFYIDSTETRGTYVMSFGPCECRPLTILFNPTTSMPYAASLHLVYDKNSDFSRKIKLHGCGGGEPVRWSGLVTYGETALVRAVLRRPIELTLYNRGSVPAFISATVHFNLQYRCLSFDSELQGSRRVLGRRGRHSVVLRVNWPRLERRARAVDATTLATLTVLTGPELTRRRMLKIIRDEKNGQLDSSLLPDHLKVLVEQFEGEDPTIDKYLENFSETKASLNELIEGLHELTAQIDVPQDFTDDNTILISDDTVLEHHTLCE
ncbi:unnamed protein product [Leptosia nina]|uniref:Centrosomal protein of 192 kDa n=1 Tax=Leptosia nina TaxID=320188 RepID=A0AAV1K1P4_9NEOP